MDSSPDSSFVEPCDTWRMGGCVHEPAVKLDDLDRSTPELLLPIRPRAFLQPCATARLHSPLAAYRPPSPPGRLTGPTTSACLITAAPPTFVNTMATPTTCPTPPTLHRTWASLAPSIPSPAQTLLPRRPNRPRGWRMASGTAPFTPATSPDPPRATISTICAHPS